MAQMRYLSFRHGVYFPWKVCYHLLENDRWEDKHSGSGKDWDAHALAQLPKTVAFIKNLPFKEIGRAVLFGLEPNDHAPAHRDTEPGSALAIPQSINFDPRGDKGLYLKDADGGSHTTVNAPIYWFNDMDYHGVLAAPRFRYSIRVDGVFEPAFVKKLEAAHARR
jgi:Rieske 2Fe-2S family protein